MLMVSREIVSPGAVGFVLLFVVILTARRAVFIWGDTDVIVPWTMVPSVRERVSERKLAEQEAEGRFSGRSLEKQEMIARIPFLSSIVTVSF